MFYVIARSDDLENGATTYWSGNRFVLRRSDAYHYSDTGSANLQIARLKMDGITNAELFGVWNRP